MPWPEDAFRLDLHARDFETEEQAVDEARLRANILRIDAAKHGGDWGRRARALANKIDPDLNPRFSRSLADPRYMRDQRIRIIGALWKLYDSLGHLNVRRCDVIRTDWNLGLVDFIDEDAARVKNEFRSTIVRTTARLQRQGIETAGRFIFAALHGEFDPDGMAFQLHYHVVEDDQAAIVIDSLRDRQGFITPRRSDAVELGAADGHVATPVRVTHAQLTNVASALGYLLKSYWLQYPRIETATGSKKLTGKGRRIQSPFLSAQLLWMDKFDIADMILMVGLRVTREGLIQTTSVQQ